MNKFNLRWTGQVEDRTDKKHRNNRMCFEHNEMDLNGLDQGKIIFLNYRWIEWNWMEWNWMEWSWMEWNWMEWN